MTISSLHPKTMNMYHISPRIINNTNPTSVLIMEAKENTAGVQIQILFFKEMTPNSILHH